MSNVNSDQIRQLTNRVHLAGALAELGEVREGKTQNGVPYISFDGAIQCGPSAVQTVRFRTFVKSKKNDGTDSKNYSKIKEWVANAVPMTKNTEEPTMVDMIGSVTDNPYVSSDGQLHEHYQFSTQVFNPFKEYCAELDLEGYIQSVTEETKDDEPTGRSKMRLITTDIFRNTLDFKNIIVDADLAPQLEDAGYVRGATTTIFVTLTPNEPVAQVKRGGIGKQRSTEGRSYLEWVMTGADPLIEEDSPKALTSALIKAAMTERQSRLKEIEEKGYQGNKGENTAAPANGSRKGVATSTPTASAPKANKVASPIVEDEDFPF